MLLVSHSRIAAISGVLRASSSSRVRGQSRAEQARKAAVGQHLAAGLAGGAVVGFVVGIADALDGRAAARAGLAEAAVDGHLGAERGDPSGNFFLASATRRSIQEVKRERVAVEKALPLVRLELVRERDGRELRGVKDLVGVGVAHAADEARIGEGALEGAVFAA